MAKNVKSDLAALSRSWKDAEPSEGGFFEVPDGEHDVEIVDAEIGYSKNDRLQAVLEMKLINGDHQGKTFKKFCGMEDDEQLGYIKGDLKRLEVDFPDEIEDLPDTLDQEVIGLFARVKVARKTKGEKTFTNIYFLEKLTDPDTGDQDDEPKGKSKKEEDDDPPRRRREQDDDDAPKGKSKGKEKDDDDQDDDPPPRRRNR